MRLGVVDIDHVRAHEIHRSEPGQIKRGCASGAYVVCMARLNVYVPDELAERARAANVNVSAVAQVALADELNRRRTNAWLDELPPLRGARSHEAAIAALHEGRDAFDEPL